MLLIHDPTLRKGFTPLFRRLQDTTNKFWDFVDALDFTVYGSF